MSLYERLVKHSWAKGRFTTEAEDGGALPVENWERPEVVREKLKADMERIVTEEAETPLAHKEAGMKLAKFVKFREEKFGGVLFETRSEKVYTLNPTAAAVVREITSDGQGDVITRLKQKYQDPSGHMEAEAKSFLVELKEKGLVTE